MMFNKCLYLIVLVNFSVCLGMVKSTTSELSLQEKEKIFNRVCIFLASKKESRQCQYALEKLKKAQEDIQKLNLKFEEKEKVLREVKQSLRCLIIFRDLQNFNDLQDHEKDFTTAIAYLNALNFDKCVGSTRTCFYAEKNKQNIKESWSPFDSPFNSHKIIEASLAQTSATVSTLVVQSRPQTPIDQRKDVPILQTPKAGKRAFSRRSDKAARDNYACVKITQQRAEK